MPPMNYYLYLTPLFCFLLFQSFPSYSQSKDTLIYFNDRWEETCCKDSATFYRKGKYDHGICDSLAKDYYLSGELQMEGTYTEGLEHGTFTWYFRNGKKMAVAEYVNGNINLREGWDTSGVQVVKKGNGFFTWYHLHNMKIQTQVRYKKGLATGPSSIFYNSEGKKIAEVYTEKQRKVVNIWDENGEKHQIINGNGKVILHYKNGTIKSSGEMIDNMVTGKQVTYFSNGKISSEETFIKDKKEGTGKYYYNNGQILSEMIYSNGMAAGRAIWYHNNGAIQCIGYYDKGNKSGDWRWYDVKKKEIGFQFF